MRIFALLLASLLCVGIARSGLRIRALAEPAAEPQLRQTGENVQKDDPKTETKVEAEDEDDEDDEDEVEEDEDDDEGDEFPGSLDAELAKEEEPAAEPQLLQTGENVQKDDLKTETNVEAEDEDDEDDEDAWWQRHCKVCAKARDWRRCLRACRRAWYRRRARPGACGAGIFTSGNLGPKATYQKALAVFVRSCAGGAGAHPKVLCESGADELFKGKDMAALFSERPDGAFCKSLKDIQKTHRDWKRAQRQAMMLGRTKEQKHAFARLENAVQGKGGYRRRRHFRRRRAPDSCKWNRRRCG